MNVLSLFAGIGGLELGLERAGMTVVGQVEINQFARSVLEHHWPEVPRHDDVRTAPAWWASRPRPQVDLVCGGFPCQPFSTAGRRHGTADERWGWPWMADVIRLVGPRYVLVENVAALLNDTDAFGWLLGDLATLGFDARWGVLPACAVGAPHTRDRLFLLAHPHRLDGTPRLGTGPQRRRYRAETEARIRGLIQSTGSWRPHPNQVEWLMGFPEDWTRTASPHWATPSSPPSANTSADSCSPPTTGTRPEQDTAMTTARPLHAVPDDPPTDHTPDWDAPMPLGSSRPVPPFPVDALPDWMAAHVTAVADLTQTPPDLAGFLALAALSTAAGGRVRVEIRPGWTEPVNLYSVVVLPPASRKSAVFKAMTRPIRAVEKELVEQAKVDIEAARIGRRAAQEFADRAEKAVLATTDGADRDAALESAVNAAMQVDKNAPPKSPRLIADDATPEVVATLLADHGGRIAVLSAEGGLFGTLAGRYSGAPNLDVFLKGHAGDLHLVDRQGREATAVEEPAITLGLTIQPSVLDGLARNESFRGTGLLARIMYSLPTNTVGNRISRPVAPDPEIGDAYDLRVRSLVRELAEWTDPAVLVFTPAADDLMADLQDEIEPRLHPVTGSWAHLGDWGGKQAGLTARIAALLHLAHNPTSWAGAITTDIFTAARRITDYAAHHALAAFDRMGSDPVIDAAQTILAWIERTRPTSFTVRELFTAMNRAHFKKVADLAPALEVLEQHGHVHQAPIPERRGPGRKPSPTFYVHPTHRAEDQR